MSQAKIEKEEFWCESVSVWKESGLSARKFCLQEGLAYQSFLSWKRRFREEPDCFIELEDEKVNLVELNIGNISLNVSPELSPPLLSHLILSLHLASQQC